MKLQTRYRCRYTHRQTRDVRAFIVYAWNKLDADVAADKLLAAAEGDHWRDHWWPFGAERDS